MHEFFSREPDPVESMLRPSPPVENETMRQAVYARTRSLLHRRHRWRQLAYAASLLFSFALGAGAMRLTIPGDQAQVSAPSAQKQSESPRALVALTQPRSPIPDDSALVKEYRAFDSEDQRGELYRQAGDRYMTEENDPQSALRCYSNALDNASEQDLTISSADNWLLMVIKDARQKENYRAKQGG